MSTLLCLKLSFLLWFVYMNTQFLLLFMEQGPVYLMGPRDEARELRGVYPPRGRRAFDNYMESFPVFLALDLALVITHHHTSLGAILWIISRTLYLPYYMFALSPWRSIAWGGALTGLVLMMWPLL